MTEPVEYVKVFAIVTILGAIIYGIASSIYAEIQRTQPVIDSCRITQGELPCKYMNETCREMLCVMPNAPITNWLPILGVVIVAAIALFIITSPFLPFTY